jgi:hypothetical protein
MKAEVISTTTICSNKNSKEHDNMLNAGPKNAVSAWKTSHYIMATIVLAVMTMTTILLKIVRMTTTMAMAVMKTILTLKRDIRHLSQCQGRHHHRQQTPERRNSYNKNKNHHQPGRPISGIARVQDVAIAETWTAPTMPTATTAGM